MPRLPSNFIDNNKLKVSDNPSIQKATLDLDLLAELLILICGKTKAVAQAIENLKKDKV